METTFADGIAKFKGFTDIQLNITHPLKLSTNLEFKALTLITGLNNSGKSFVNKLLWASATFFNMKLVEKVTGVKDTEKSDEEVLQYILDNTFNGNDLEGTVAFFSRDDVLKVAYYKISFTLEKGKISDLVIDFPADAEPMGAITYLSKEAREFTNIERYLKTKKMLGINDLSSWADLEALGEWYKLYDVFAIESLLPKFENANKILEMVSSMGSEMIDEIGVKSLEFDKEAGKLWYYGPKDDIKRTVSTLGAGSQSILLMLMSAV